jgi:hypothetical protein
MGQPAPGAASSDPQPPLNTHGRAWLQRKTPAQSNSGEITMRPATFYYLTQAWPGQRRQSQPGTRSRARRGRHAMAPRRYRPARELPALARRVIATLTGSSQPA